MKDTSSSSPVGSSYSDIARVLIDNSRGYGSPHRNRRNMNFRKLAFAILNYEASGVRNRKQIKQVLRASGYSNKIIKWLDSYQSYPTPGAAMAVLSVIFRQKNSLYRRFARELYSEFSLGNFSWVTVLSWITILSIFFTVLINIAWSCEAEGATPLFFGALMKTFSKSTGVMSSSPLTYNRALVPQLPKPYRKTIHIYESIIMSQERINQALKLLSSLRLDFYRKTGHLEILSEVKTILGRMRGSKNKVAEAHEITLARQELDLMIGGLENGMTGEILDRVNLAINLLEARKERLSIKIKSIENMVEKIIIPELILLEPQVPYDAQAAKNKTSIFVSAVSGSKIKAKGEVTYSFFGVDKKFRARIKEILSGLVVNYAHINTVEIFYGDHKQGWVPQGRQDLLLWLSRYYPGETGFDAKETKELWAIYRGVRSRTYFNVCINGDITAQFGKITLIEKKDKATRLKIEVTPSSGSSPVTGGYCITSIGGGSGPQKLVKGLISRGAHLYNIITVFDNGFSTGILRRHLDMPAIGDLRNRLVALLPNTLENKLVEEILNHRFPRETETRNSNSQLKNQLLNLIEAKERASGINISGELRTFLQGSIEYFIREKIENANTGFPLFDANVGNIIVASQYFAAKRNILKAIDKISGILGVNTYAQLIPASLANLDIAAKMKNNSVIYGQYEIDHRFNQSEQIERIIFVRRGTRKEVKLPSATHESLAAILESDAIVIGPGSITSYIPALAVKGNPEALRLTRAAKIFVVNISWRNFRYSSAESKGLAASDMVRLALLHLRNADKHPSRINTDYIEYALVNVPKENETYYTYADIANIRAMGIKPVMGDFEDEEAKSYHDSAKISEVIYGIISRRGISGKKSSSPINYPLEARIYLHGTSVEKFALIIRDGFILPKTITNKYSKPVIFLSHPDYGQPGYFSNGVLLYISRAKLVEQGINFFRENDTVYFISYDSIPLNCIVNLEYYKVIKDPLLLGKVDAEARRAGILNSPEYQ
ncbi:MAG: 2-phospho-L-lactate transferase CofD family protein, partial [Candidatus Omnitrophota bacterium]